jgi:hypothetical protein
MGFNSSLNDIDAFASQEINDIHDPSKYPKKLRQSRGDDGKF